LGNICVPIGLWIRWRKWASLFDLRDVAATDRGDYQSITYAQHGSRTASEVHNGLFADGRRSAGRLQQQGHRNRKGQWDQHAPGLPRFDRYRRAIVK
jgi:hypothetical protein